MKFTQDSSVAEHLTHNQGATGSTPVPAPTFRRKRNENGINTGKYQTPGSALIDLHYAKLRVHRRWTWERFIRLAGFLRLTTGELASTVCLSHRSIEGCCARNQFPPPVALLLTMLEGHVCKGFVPDAIENPLPNLNAHPNG